MIDLILAAMLALPQYVADRSDTPEARAALYRPTAQAIAEVSNGNRVKAAALIALAYEESRFARYVLEGRCKDGPKGSRCDWNYLTRSPRARGPWQLWSWCTDAWRHPDGSIESLRSGARCASRLLAGAKQRCLGRHPAGDWAGAYSGYRNGACTWAPAAGRARRMAAIEARLRG
jgi:hypothetical protein